MGAVVVSTALPNCREGRLHPIGSVNIDWLRRVGTRAEELGYDTLWLNEFLQTDPNVAKKFAEPPQNYDALMVIAIVGEHTQRIRFVTSTVILPLHEPLLLARQVTTVDHATNGRVTLGIGLGGAADEFKLMRGELEAPNRGQMLDEYLFALRTLWGDDRKASFEGRYARFSNVEQHPKPVQRPVPIYMAGQADGVFRRLVEHGQGWIDTTQLPDGISASADRIAQLSREAGRADDIAITRQMYISIADSMSEARRNYEESLVHSVSADSPNPPGIEMTLIGTPDGVRERLQEYVIAGATEICAIFYSPDEASAVRQMELFASEVMPALKAGA